MVRPMRASPRASFDVKQSAAFELDGELLRVAVIADTHGHPHPRSLELVRAEAPHRILHAGDIGDLGVLAAFAEVAPVVAVRGNIDVHATDLPDAVTVDVRAAGASLVKLLLVHIAVVGPKLRADAARLARSEKADLVVCGHSHVPFVGSDRGLAILNPGSIGPRRFQLPIVFAVIEIRATGVTMRHVDCETGQRWSP